MISEIINRVKYKSKVYFRTLFYFLSPKTKNEIVKSFHQLYYDSNVLGGTWKNTKFLGVPAQKCPLDLFVYQEILFEVKPDLIIEAGTASGGGAYFLASMCDLIGHGEVVTIDITNTRVSPSSHRIKYILGSSTSEDVYRQIEVLAKDKRIIMVILDSDHSKKHVLKELELYNKFVSKGSYLIVEDTNVNGHPVNVDHGPGPMEALKEFLKTNDNFEIDTSREKHYLTFNPSGYLKRIN